VTSNIKMATMKQKKPAVVLKGFEVEVEENQLLLEGMKLKMLGAIPYRERVHVPDNWVASRPLPEEQGRLLDLSLQEVVRHSL
jgi:hypothetical protein